MIAENNIPDKTATSKPIHAFPEKALPTTPIKAANNMVPSTEILITPARLEISTAIVANKIGVDNRMTEKRKFVEKISLTICSTCQCLLYYKFLLQALQ